MKTARFKNGSGCHSVTAQSGRKQLSVIPTVICFCLIIFPEIAFSQNIPLRLIDSTLGSPLGDTANPNSPTPQPEKVIDTNIVISVLDFPGLSLQDAFRALVRAYGLSMYIDSSVVGNITLRLENVSLNDALLFIFKEHSLTWEKTGGIIKVYRPKVPPPALPPIEIQFADQQISFNLSNVELSRFVDALIRETGRNFIMDGATRGVISGQVVDIELEKGLRAVLNSNGFSFNEVEGVYHIGFLEKPESGDAANMRYSVSCQEDLLTLDVRNAPLGNVLSALSDKCGRAIITYGKVEGTVSASYKDIPFTEALDNILRLTPYSYKKDGEIFFVGDKKAQELYSSRLIKLKHVSNKTIPELIPSVLAGQVSVKPVPEQNGIVVTGPATALTEIEGFIRQVDIAPAQVLFEAIVVDYNLSKFKEFNLTANNTGQKVNLPDHIYYPNIDYSNTGAELNKHLDNIADYLNIKNIGHLSKDFYMRLRIMEEEGIANIRSRPQIAALNGHEASIRIGTSQYYLLESKTVYPSEQSNVSTQTSQRFEVIEADMSLEVTPWVTESGEVIVEIEPKFNSPVSGFNPDIPPTINHRILKSTVRLRDGETIILGGMIQDIDNITIKKVPLLGDIPILGRLFQNRSSTKTKATLMVYLTPHIYYGAEGSVEPKEISD